jgi:hypothetical protein
MRIGDLAAASGVSVDTLRFAGILGLADGGPAGCDTVRDLAQAKIDDVTTRSAG